MVLTNSYLVAMITSVVFCLARDVITSTIACDKSPVSRRQGVIRGGGSKAFRRLRVGELRRYQLINGSVDRLDDDVVLVLSSISTDALSVRATGTVCVCMPLHVLALYIGAYQVGWFAAMLNMSSSAIKALGVNAVRD